MSKEIISGEQLRKVILTQLRDVYTFEDRMDNPNLVDNGVDVVFDGVRDSKCFRWVGHNIYGYDTKHSMIYITLSVQCYKFNIPQDTLNDLVRVHKVFGKLGIDYYVIGDLLEHTHCKNELQVAFSIGQSRT